MTEKQAIPQATSHTTSQAIPQVVSRGIVMTGPQVLATMQHRKTETRRITGTLKDINKDPGAWQLAFSADIKETRVFKFKNHQTGEYRQYKSPYGRPGHHLYVKEAFTYVADDFAITPGVAYQAGQAVRWLQAPSERSVVEGKTVYNESKPDAWKWRSPWYMPRVLSRVRLEVEHLWVERLHDISVEAIIREGLYTQLREHAACVDLREQWDALWDSINAKRGFPADTNPWVLAVQYSVLEVKREEDMLS